MAKILLVEDEPWLGELYRQLLSEQHTVTWLRDPYTVMDAVDQDRPDIIVLDILLSGASGVQLLHELASYSDTARIPKVLFSAALPADISSEALRAYGVTQTLDKTVAKPKQVLQTINDIITAHANAQN